MATPLTESDENTIRAFISEHGLPPTANLDLVSHRLGHAVLHLHHEGLDYTLKHFSSKSDEAAHAFRREHQFYVFLKPLQTGQTPLLLGSDEKKQTLLLTRITGRPPRESEVDRHAVGKAGSFISTLYAHRSAAVARLCGPAQDACHSIADHLSATSELIAAIQQHHQQVNPQTQAFIDDELNPIWQKTLAQTLEQFGTAGIDVAAQFNAEQLCLSPGEFGFHNAILTPEKDICFVDFDEAGWDDPARVICQLFTRGTLPTKDELWDAFLEPLGQLTESDPVCAIRARLLLPAYQIARACRPILNCLQEQAATLSEEDSAGHSKTRLISVMNSSRRWLIRANQSR